VPLSLTDRPQWRVATATVAAAIVLSGLTGCDISVAAPDTAKPKATATDAPDTKPGTPGKSTGDPAAAKAQLKKLAVATAASMKGYSRDRFPHWRSAGPNCDVRDSVLKRDGQKVKLKGCGVTGGSWTSLYDGAVITDPSLVDVDHMVPLANAWRSGAGTWTDDKRGDFANDLDDPQLIAVSASSNRSKGDQDPSTWKPKRTEAWCQYAEAWIAVKSHWKLWVTTAEKAALAQMLETC
jgi:hypothetical protein